MQWFVDMSVRSKLISGFLLLAAIVAFVGLRGAQSMARIARTTETFYNEEAKPARTLALADTRYHHTRLSLYEMIAATGTPEYERFAKAYEADMAELERLLKELGAYNLEATEKSLWQELTRNAVVGTDAMAMRRVLEDPSRTPEERRSIALAAMIDSESKAETAANCVAFEKVGGRFDEHAAAATQDARTFAQDERRLFIAIVAGTTAVALLIGFVLASLITKPLAVIARAVDRLAEGHLAIPELPSERQDEIGHLAKRLIATIQAQRHLIGEIKQSSDQVATSADEISASSVQITKGAENQSSATDQTSSTMVEMATQIDQVARSAQNLARNVDETSSSIQEIGASIEQVAKNAENLLSSVEETSSTIDQMAASIRSVASKVKVVDEASKEAETIARSGATELSGVINGIGASSKDIGKIVKIIEEIADQTNLLALNAAIEAARAGDAGKGFAVVAEEVKRLAERSMSSTREISAFVERVQKDVGQAVDLSGSVLRSIRDSVGKSSSLVSEVYTSAQEQSNGAAQILKTANNMQNVTRQLATAAKQQATAAREIMTSVETMNRMTQEVASATTEQKNGGDMVVKAVEQISQVAQQNVASTEQLSKATAGLAREAERMRGLSQQFVF